MKNRLHFLLLLLFFMAGALAAQGITFHGSARNSIYAFESDKVHTRFFQYLNFTAVSPCRHLALNSNLRFLTDANQDLDNDMRFRAFALTLEARNLLDGKLNLAFGRQFLHPGTALGALDGLNARYAFDQRFSLQLYGGVESVASRAFKIQKFADASVVGGAFQVKKVYASTAQLFYLRKFNSEAAYWQITGANLESNLVPYVQLRLQSHYDLENERLHRLLLNASRSWNGKLATFIEYKRQNPQVYANSYYTIFEVKPYSQIRTGADYALTPGLAVEAQYQHLMFDADQADRILLSLNNDDGSIGMMYETGYTGDQISAYFNYGYEILPKLVASLYADYSKYRTETIYEYDDQIANAARLSYSLGRWNFVGEYQWLTNRLKENDSRFLNHITYRW
ncbi:MAG TPA: hypothetical protein PLG50_00530 [bacterium]|nr:hypothetical protein [bacterium]HQG44126.1 hypothetical protein [bacterium]HQJ64341.1 hypothetical protein [bacterium]HQJ65453.1 hypothetical protein [bacterium]